MMQLLLSNSNPSQENLIVFRDGKKLLQKGRKSVRLEGHEDKVTRVGISECGRNLVSSGKDGPLRCWDTLNRQQTFCMADKNITCCTVEPPHIVVGTDKGLIHIFKRNTTL